MESPLREAQNQAMKNSQKSPTPEHLRRHPVRWTQRLSTRIALLASIVTLLVLAVSMVLLHGKSEEVLVEGEARKAQEVSVLLSRALQNAVLEDRPDQVRRILNETAPAIRGLRHVEAHALDGTGLGAWSAEAVQHTGTLVLETIEIRHPALQTRTPIGSISLGMSRAHIQKKMSETAMHMTGIALLATLLAFAFIMVVTARQLAPLGRTDEALEAVAEGNFKQSLQPMLEDEVGRITCSVNAAVSMMREAIDAIGTNADTLGVASEELSIVSADMSTSSRDVESKARNNVLTAQRVGRNVEAAARGADDMAASVLGIATSAREAAKVATSAAHIADSTNATFTKLSDSNAEIDRVVELITAIAEHTNLLALNAAIEAARAGEAGKGFQVVALEVKELSLDTAAATKEIRERISAIQKDTQEAVAAIQQITTIISQVNETQLTIASAVDRQTETTRVMGESLTDAARSTQEIANTAEWVAEAMERTSEGAANARKSADQLAAMSNRLQGLVQRFQC
jgi:methyl-accepting chemotaxis protein